MGFDQFPDKVSGDEDIKKSFQGSLSLLAKADRMGRVMEKRVFLESAENGFILRVSVDLEFGEGEKRDWQFISKNYVFPSLEEAMPKMEEEMKNFKPGMEVKLADVLKDEKADVKVRAMSKRNLSFTTGDGDGHVHVANGTIVDKVINGEAVKVFEGETNPESTYWKMGKPEEGSNESDFTKKVAATLASHKHKFTIVLSKYDEAGWRIYGQTSKAEEHDHPIDFLDFTSTPVTNSPDKK